MITFTRKIAGKEVRVPVYEGDKEAALHGVTSIGHWKKAQGRTDSGYWVTTDDGYVVQVLKTRKRFLATTVAWAGFRAGTVIEARSRIRNRSWSRFTDVTWQQALSRNRRWQYVVRHIAMANLMKKEPDWEHLGQMWAPNAKIPVASVKVHLKDKEIQKMISDKMKEILTNNGVTEDAVVKMVLEGYQVAKDEKDPGNMLKAAFGLGEYLEMNPSKKSSVQLPPWIGSPVDDPELIKRIEEAKSEVLPQHMENIDTDSGAEYIDPGKDEEYVDPKKYLDERARENSQ